MSFKQLNCSREYLSVFMGFTLLSCQDYKMIFTDVSEIERSRPESERRKCPKSDGTVRNQMILSVIRRKRSESGGNVRNQTEASCGIRDLCHLFPCLQIGKRLKKLNNIIGTN